MEKPCINKVILSYLILSYLMGFEFGEASGTYPAKIDPSTPPGGGGGSFTCTYVISSRGGRASSFRAFNRVHGYFYGIFAILQCRTDEL